MPDDPMTATEIFKKLGTTEGLEELTEKPSETDKGSVADPTPTAAEVAPPASGPSEPEAAAASPDAAESVPPTADAPPPAPAPPPAERTYTQAEFDRANDLRHAGLQRSHSQRENELLRQINALQKPAPSAAPVAPVVSIEDEIAKAVPSKFPENEAEHQNQMLTFGKTISNTILAEAERRSDAKVDALKQERQADINAQNQHYRTGAQSRVENAIQNQAASFQAIPGVAVPTAEEYAQEIQNEAGRWRDAGMNFNDAQTVRAFETGLPKMFNQAIANKITNSAVAPAAALNDTTGIPASLATDAAVAGQAPVAPTGVAPALPKTVTQMVKPSGDAELGRGAGPPARNDPGQFSRRPKALQGSLAAMRGDK